MFVMTGHTATLQKQKSSKAGPFVINVVPARLDLKKKLGSRLQFIIRRCHDSCLHPCSC